MPTPTKRGFGTETIVDGDPETAATVNARPGPGRGAPDTEPTGAHEAAPVRGGTIGRFVLLGELGSGGMGHVYSAYDPHLDRKVALKLLRASMMRGATDGQARLLREAQAMAKINHPSVVRVHEVGTHDGQVYLAMEFVEGGTLRAYLETRHPQREIIDVLVQAGRGLAAAHAVGLVHRDFKPDNVLMDKDGSPRVTDFGIVGVAAPSEAAPPPAAPAAPPSAALDLAVTLDLPDRPSSPNTPLGQSLTRTGAVMGTPQYMAPEQFTGTPATARTDQFSFCVVLYEALYGQRPFPGESFQELASTVLVGEVPPPPRGARVPGWLRRVLLRGLAVDPSARHASMEALLSELLRDRVRQRRRILTWTAGAAVPLAAALALALRTGDGAVCDAGDGRVARVWSPARREALRAAFLASGRPHAAASFDKLAPMLDAWSRAWGQGYRDACEDTRVRLEQSEHLLDLRMQCLTRRLDEADATIALLGAGGGETVDHALDAAQKLPLLAPCSDAAALTAAVAPPETELGRAQVQAVRGQLDAARGLERLGRYAAALTAARAALAAARATDYRPVTAEALLVVGQSQLELADPAGVPALRESMHTAAAAGDAAGMIAAAAPLVSALAAQGDRYEIAREIAALAEAIAQNARPGPELSVRLQISIGRLDHGRTRLADARARYTAALALAEQALGPDHPATLDTLKQLGDLTLLEGKFAEARGLFERVLASRERVFGKEHPDIARALNDLGHVYQTEGKFDDARRVYDRALAISIAALGPEHPAVGSAYNSIGGLHASREEHAAAEGYFVKALALWENAYGPSDIRIASALTNLATSLSGQGKREQAVALFERVIALREAAHGPEHLELAASLMNLGIARQRQGRLDDALALYRRTAKILEAAYGPEHPDLADALGNIATVLQEQHKLDEARAMTLRVLRLFEQAYGAEHPRVGMGYFNLGSVQLEERDHAGALASFQKSAAIFEAKLGRDHALLAYALRGIGSCLVTLHRTDEALPHLARASQIRRAGGAPPVTIDELRSPLPEPLVKDPRTRARELAEIKAAAAAYEQAGDAANAAEARRWLAAHGGG
ncbi:MAG TPA: serine/threonine-protein kinase [Kofleriaceae bacterium]|nr:serine/threonine-protein kinase [Kofleriaceae bacterium]